MGVRFPGLRQVYSKFYYGLEVDENSYTLAFDEGNGTIIAEVDVGLYSPELLKNAISRALNEAGTNEYSCAFNRSNRKFTVTSNANFKILGATGGDTGTSILPVIGFNMVDTTNAISHTSNNPSGNVYSPQFWLQNYTPSRHAQSSAMSTVHKSASGKVQVQNFGREFFTTFNITMITNIDQHPTSPIRTNPNAVEEALEFMEWCSRKAPVEFMYDETKLGDYEIIMLENARGGRDGTGFELDELYDKGMLGYFETGNLKFRRIEES